MHDVLISHRHAGIQLKMTVCENTEAALLLPRSAGCWPPAHYTLHCRWSRDCCLLQTRTTLCHDAVREEQTGQWVSVMRGHFICVRISLSRTNCIKAEKVIMIKPLNRSQDLQDKRESQWRNRSGLMNNTLYRKLYVTVCIAKTH